MSYQERRSLFNLISTVLITLLYTAYMIQRYPEASPYSPEIFHFWGAFFLILIPVMIILKILSYVLFTLVSVVTTHEVEPDVTDERDKLIELRAGQRSVHVFSLGFILAMIALVMSQPPAVMFTILLCAGIASEVVSDLLHFYYYRRGF